MRGRKKEHKTCLVLSHQFLVRSEGGFVKIASPPPTPPKGSGNAKNISSQVMSGPATQVAVVREGQWQKAIVLQLFYGDYKGRAKFEFYVQRVGGHELMIVFIDNVENEKQ
jgi:hypothetical protein